MRYMIVSARSVEVLIEFVQQAIDAGWRPQGGVCDGGSSYLQAMTREIN